MVKTFKKKITEQTIINEIRSNLEEQLVSIYESGDEQTFAAFVTGLTEEQIELLGLNEFVQGTNPQGFAGVRGAPGAQSGSYRSTGTQNAGRRGVDPTGRTFRPSLSQTRTASGGNIPRGNAPRIGPSASRLKDMSAGDITRNALGAQTFTPTQRPTAPKAPMARPQITKPQATSPQTQATPKVATPTTPTQPPANIGGNYRSGGFTAPENVAQNSRQTGITPPSAGGIAGGLNKISNVAQSGPASFPTSGPMTTPQAQVAATAGRGGAAFGAPVAMTGSKPSAPVTSSTAPPKAAIRESFEHFLRNKFLKG